MSDEAIEQEIQAKSKTAPRITPDHIKATIAQTHFFTAANGVRGAAVEDGVDDGSTAPLELLTFCVLVLRNGFTVTGESACASPENFDAEIGRKVARQNAEQKIWALEGYLLKQRLFEAGNTPPALGSDLPPHQQRVMDEHTELNEKRTKLAAFFQADLFKGLPLDEQDRMQRQHDAMLSYAGILIERIAAF